MWWQPFIPAATKEQSSTWKRPRKTSKLLLNTTKKSTKLSLFGWKMVKVCWEKKKEINLNVAGGHPSSSSSLIHPSIHSFHSLICPWAEFLFLFLTHWLSLIFHLPSYFFPSLSTTSRSSSVRSFFPVSTWNIIISRFRFSYFFRLRLNKKGFSK